MMEIQFLRQLFARQHDLIGVDDNDIVASVHMRGEGRFVLAAQDFGNFCGQTAQSFIGRVHNVPFTFDSGRICHERFHSQCPSQDDSV